LAFDRYFDERSRRFARFYGNERLARALGRAALFERARYAVDMALARGASHVLDVGCGSGPLFEPLATRGVRVTGLEPAARMRELACVQASRFGPLVGVEDRPWESIEESDAYDLAVALGIFDYVQHADDLMLRLGRASPAVVASFPSPGLRTTLRKLRYGVRGVSVHGYSRQQILDLADVSGMVVDDIRPLGRAGCVVCFVRRGAGPSLPSR
jgi:predicted TPR repeat methyltransferase